MLTNEPYCKVLPSNVLPFMSIKSINEDRMSDYLIYKNMMRHVSELILKSITMDWLWHLNKSDHSVRHWDLFWNSERQDILSAFLQQKKIYKMLVTWVRVHLLSNKFHFLSCGSRGCFYIAQKIYINAVIMISFHLSQMFLLNLLKRDKNTNCLHRSIELHECRCHTLDMVLIESEETEIFILKSLTLDCRLLVSWQNWAHYETTS